MDAAMGQAAGLRIYTIGHSTRAPDELLAMLRARGVATLVDVRTIPRSRRNPQFARESLSESRAQASIRYLHMPGLGGLRRPRPDSINTGWRNTGFRAYGGVTVSSILAERCGALPPSLDKAVNEECVKWFCKPSVSCEHAICCDPDCKVRLETRILIPLD